ncbi:hypothetical protein ACWKT5_23925 [Streptomyces avermitilis]
MTYYFDDPLVDVTAHQLQITPAGQSSSLLGLPTQLVTATCSCGRWHNNKRWQRSAHLELFDQHMHEVQEHAHATARLAERLTPSQLRLLVLVQEGGVTATASGHSVSSFAEPTLGTDGAMAALERLAIDGWIVLPRGKGAALTLEGRTALLNRRPRS